MKPQPNSKTRECRLSLVAYATVPLFLTSGAFEENTTTLKKQMHSPQSMLSLLSKLLFCVFTDFRFVVGRTCLPWLYALHPGQNMNSVFAGKRAYNPNANSCSRLGAHQNEKMPHVARRSQRNHSSWSSGTGGPKRTHST